MDKGKFKKRSKNYFSCKTKRFNLIDVTIFHLDERSNLIEKIISKKRILKIIYGLKRCTII